MILNSNKVTDLILFLWNRQNYAQSIVEILIIHCNEYKSSTQKGCSWNKYLINLCEQARWQSDMTFMNFCHSQKDHFYEMINMPWYDIGLESYLWKIKFIRMKKVDRVIYLCLFIIYFELIREWEQKAFLSELRPIFWWK